MKLSENAKTRLRKIIEEEVKNVPEGQRVKLDTDLLEELIFFHGTAKINDSEYEKEFKVPVWTGDFLSKIDLSELSFKNVVLERLATFEDIAEISEDTRKSFIEFEYEDSRGYKEWRDDFPFVLEDRSILGNNRNTFPFVNFRNTNINIDFSEAVDEWLACWDLSGVDLSKSSIEKINAIDGSNLSRTNIKAANAPWLEEEPYDEDNDDKQNFWFSIYHTDLSNNDLSGIHTNIMNIIEADNNISNTGVRIDYLQDIDDRTKAKFESRLRSGHLYGCYLNDLLIKNEQTLEDIIRRKEQKNFEDKENEGKLITQLPGMIRAQLPKAELNSDEQKERLFKLRQLFEDDPYSFQNKENQNMSKDSNPDQSGFTPKI